MTVTLQVFLHSLSLPRFASVQQETILFVTVGVHHGVHAPGVETRSAQLLVPGVVDVCCQKPPPGRYSVETMVGVINYLVF